MCTRFLQKNYATNIIFNAPCSTGKRAEHLGFLKKDVLNFIKIYISAQAELIQSNFCSSLNSYNLI